MGKKSKPRIAIIGAGISGLTLARALRKDAAITVFEKSRGVGGRMSTRRTEQFAFDHGTQFFTARSRAFRDFLAPFKEAGVVTEWAGDVVTLEAGKEPKELLWFEPHFVAVPTMNSLCKAMAEGIELVVGTEVAPLAPKEDAWLLQDTQGNALGEFDWVISTAPVVQTVRLLGKALPRDNPIAPLTLQGCYALMVGFDTPQTLPWIGAKLAHGPLGWISVNSSKPARDAKGTTIVAHSRNDWAEEHIEDDAATVQATLVAALEEATGLDCAKAAHVAMHRWRYALVDGPTRPGPYVDVAKQLAAVGDWSVASRIEECWYASMDLAEKIRTQL